MTKTKKNINFKYNKIYNLDSSNYLKYINSNSVDLIVTDPPYIVDTKAGDESKYIGAGKKGSKIRDDAPYYLKKNFDTKSRYHLESMKKGFDIDFYFNEFERVLKKMNMFVFCSNKQISSIMKWGEEHEYITSCLVWHKTNSVPFANGVWRSNLEYIIHIRQKGAVFQGNSTDKLKAYISPTVRAKHKHPTQKPLELIQNYIKIGSNENDVILDPFMGSGTTAEACKNLNRNFIGFEIDNFFWKQSQLRLNKIFKQKELF